MNTPAGMISSLHRTPARDASGVTCHPLASPVDPSGCVLTPRSPSFSIDTPFGRIPLSVHDLDGPALDELPACTLCTGTGSLADGSRCPDCGGTGIDLQPALSR